jgi:hypothetical protein
MKVSDEDDLVLFTIPYSKLKIKKALQKVMLFK